VSAYADPELGMEGGEAYPQPQPVLHQCIVIGTRNIFSPPARSEISVSVLIPRTRTLGVRLSAEEYAALEKFCVESGARSISDLARNAICSLVNQTNQASALLSSLNQHSSQVKELEQRLEMLADELAMLKAGMPAQMQENTYAGGKKVDSAEKLNGAPDSEPGEFETGSS
jgi:hypothetical protein